MDFFAGLEFQEILLLVLVVFAVGLVVKKLFKLAIVIAIIIALIYYGLPLLQTVTINYF
jgi:hypothetical protein